jgi:hypothetical protein
MKSLRILLASIGLSFLAACGGGGDGGAAGTPVSGVISGTATKGPMNGATVTALGIGGGQAGARIGSATTDASGNFTMGIGGYAGPVMLQVSGGSFTDEATGTTMPMAPGDVMTVAMPTVAAGSTTSGVQVTPVTAMAQTLAQHMSGGMTDANIAAANTAMGNYFSVSDILHTQPMNPMVVGAGAGASQDSRDYGMTLAAMSQYAKSLNMTISSAMVTAMSADATDGVMDGKNGGNPISMPMGGMMGANMMASTSGTSSLATAMTSFIGSPANASGLRAADMSALIQKLSNSNGQL